MKTKFLVASVQFKLFEIKTFEEFEAKVETIIKKCSSEKVDLIVFPEYFSMLLVGLLPDLKTDKEIFLAIAKYNSRVKELLGRLAKSYKKYVVAGSIPTSDLKGDKLYNDSYIFAPSGKSAFQGKLNITEYEKESLDMVGREKLSIFETELGKIAICICYDIEFPEIARVATDNGVKLIVVPSWTDDFQGYCRVRYCAQARCIENHIYVIHSALVGSLNREPASSDLCGQSAIYCPPDKGFPMGGIVNQGEKDEEHIVIGEIDSDLLTKVRKTGSTLPLKDKETLKARLKNVDVITI